MFPKPFQSHLLFVDIIVEFGHAEIILVKRSGATTWCLPGGYVDSGESLFDAAIREVKEETGLAVALSAQLQTYSFLRPDGSCLGISTVFIGQCLSGNLLAADDVEEAERFRLDTLPEISTDHQQIITEYLRLRCFGKSPTPRTGIVSSSINQPRKVLKAA